MQNKIIILTLILLLPIVNAIPELKLAPEEIDIVVYQNKNYTFNITLYNYGDKDLYNITFQDIKGARFSKIPYIKKANVTQELNASNHTVNVTYPTIYNYAFNVSTNETFKGDYASIAKFYYYDLVTQDYTTHHINVSNSGYNPGNININQGDVVSVYNIGSEQHSFTDIAGEFDVLLNAGFTTSRNFSTIKQYNIYDKITGRVCRINVSNRTKNMLVHTTTYDKSLLLSFDSKPEQTNVTFDIFVESVVMPYSSTFINYLNIINKNNKTALEINLSGDYWLNFTENNFNLSSNSNKMLSFNISPDNITKTEDTGKNYLINITLSGINFNTVTKPLNVYIEYYDFSTTTINQNYTEIIWVDDERIKQICDSNPELCPTKNITIEKVVEKWQEVSVDGKDFQDMKETLDRTGTWMQREEVENQEDIDSIKGFIQDLKIELKNIKSDIENLNEQTLNITNQTQSRMQETENFVNDNTRELLFGIVFLIMSSILFFISIFRKEIKKFLTKKSRIGRDVF